MPPALEGRHPSVLLLALLPWLAAACATPAAWTGPVAAPGGVLTQSAPGTFTVELRLPRPVEVAAFTRPGDGDRLRTWRVLAPPEGRLEGAPGQQDRLVAPRPFDRVLLEVPVHQHEPEKDYEPFITFSGGGVLVFTGQFEVGEEEGRLPWVLRPLPGQRVVVPGATAAGPLAWAGVVGGTYAAFGPLQPIQGTRFLGVVDPGMPPWLEARTRELLPRLFDHYARELGAELQVRPTVLLAYGDAPEARTISLGGGTLEGLLQLVVRLGADRRAPGDRQVEARFLQLLAHEAAHLWNSHLAENRGPDWLHEGGAELLGWRALRAEGLLSPAAFLGELSFAASRCALLRGAGPLERDPVKARYACGAVVELACAAGSPGPEAVWARLLAGSRAAGQGGGYDAPALFAACAGAGAAEAAVAAARRFAQARAGPALPEVQALLRLAGLTATPGAAPPDFQDVARRAGQPDAPWLEVAEAAR